MPRLGLVALVCLVGCAATQEGPAPADARISQEITPDAPAGSPDALPPPDGPIVAEIDAPPPPPPPPPDAREVPVPDACVPNPAGELCNGLDDTCNGKVDEGFNLGAPCSAGVGACKRDGKLICSDDGKGTVCDAVPGKAAPFDLCGNGIDDDCDGQVDEDFPALGTLCFKGVGDCKTAGLWVCNASKDALDCNAVPGTPGPELCGTGHDESCDGNVDEGFPDLGQECTVGVGHCKANGIRICDPGDLTRTRCSTVAGDPEPESCNGVDDNCDGQIDEGDPGGGASCTTGSTGECGPGHLHCIEGRLACVPDHISTPEVCDGKDNDCDGIIDNGFHIGEACDGPDSDFCARGHLQCANLFSSECVGDSPNTPEVCNGLDDNCDGHVDEDWDFFNDPNNCGGCNVVCSGLNVDTRQCTSGACNPVCSFGWQSCDGNLTNGCETLRNTYPGAFPDPTGYAASVSGDVGRNPVVLTGFGEVRLKVRVTEDDDGFDSLHAQLRLQNPDGVSMQLCVSGAHCGGSGSACAPAGGDQSVWASADETPWPLPCNDDSFDAFVEIRFIDAERTSCGDWTLTVYSESDPPDGAINIDVD